MTVSEKASVFKADKYRMIELTLQHKVAGFLGQPCQPCI